MLMLTHRGGGPIDNVGVRRFSITLWPLYPRENSDAHFTRGWVRLGAGIQYVVNMLSNTT